MAMPMTSASPSRSKLILDKENAIKRRLAAQNEKNKTSAYNKITKRSSSGYRDYNTQSIKTGNGFTKSDYGVGNGAAIPYQLQDTKKTVTRSFPDGKNRVLHSAPDRSKSVIRSAAIQRRLSSASQKGK
jgi:hypothetical protein